MRSRIQRDGKIVTIASELKRGDASLKKRDTDRFLGLAP